MEAKEARSNFENSLAQVAKMFWMPAVDFGTPSHEFKDFIREKSADDLIQIFGTEHTSKFEHLRDYEDDDENYYEEVAQIIHEYFCDGFIVTFNIPMRVNFTEHGCRLLRGVTHCPTVYVENLNKLVEKANELSGFFKKQDKEKEDKNKLGLSQHKK